MEYMASQEGKNYLVTNLVAEVANSYYELIALDAELKTLEQKGIVKREVIPDTPVIIEYSLTEKGHSMEPILKSIENWSQEWVERDDE